jgi:hypothetical protein
VNYAACHKQKSYLPLRQVVPIFGKSDEFETYRDSAKPFDNGTRVCLYIARPFLISAASMSRVWRIERVAIRLHGNSKQSQRFTNISKYYDLKQCLRMRRLEVINTITSVRFGVLTAVTMKNGVF